MSFLLPLLPSLIPVLAPNATRAGAAVIGAAASATVGAVTGLGVAGYPADFGPEPDRNNDYLVLIGMTVVGAVAGAVIFGRRK